MNYNIHTNGGDLSDLPAKERCRMAFDFWGMGDAEHIRAWAAEREDTEVLNFLDRLPPIDKVISRFADRSNLNPT